MELLDGRSGTPHIDGEKLGVMNLGLGGADGYLYEYGEKASASVVDSNHVTIGTFAGQLPSNGRRVICQVPETVTVESGTQGQSRRDLVVVRQTSSTVGDSTTEGAALTVVRGTPVSSGTPADPETLDTDLVLWRLLISNTTLGTPVSMARVLKPLADVWDSVSQRLKPTVLYDDNSHTTEPKTITLRESAGRYRYVDVFGVDIDWQRSHTRLTNNGQMPFGSGVTASFCLTTEFGDEGTPDKSWQKFTNYLVSKDGRTITPKMWGQHEFVAGGVSTVGGIGVTIVQVVGWR